APAWVAWISVVLLFSTLCLWSTLIAGDGRRAAGRTASVTAVSMQKVEKRERSMSSKSRQSIRCGDGAIMGWGDPGAVSIRPPEDMAALVDEVKKAQGPPDSRSICRTCLVRRPLRSKHCADCGFCVGRMDHHCAWINNCVGCLNHRMFLMFVVCQWVYVIVFAYIVTASFAAEISSEGNTLSVVRNVVRSVASKQNLPVLLLLVTAAGAMMMLTGILFDQLRGIFTNTTVNERLNSKRYPWLNATPRGPPFNHYDNGPWCNLLEFLGVG
ncbi:unnamed protein product, partial [Sphacelaria rigidula]